jgi:gamma-glutamylcyclotransferase (GGCT)/AIG2-like uncharacterized protein YtfP
MRAELFVYGTLRPDAGGTMGARERSRLAAEARYLGPASTDGVLLDLGAYPGLTDGCGLVHGGLYTLACPDVTLAWLDAYEDIDGGEYVRRERTVMIAGGATLVAWVYVHIPRMPSHPIIASGDWLMDR